RLNHPALAAKALELQEVGASIQNRPAWLQRILQEFEQRQTARRAEQLRGQLSRVTDHETAVELLRRLQSPPDRPVGSSR
ncbi:MAG TPA: hypothetical protein VIL46_09090, partial [Gemmataceae bacterium]